jgi:hypothetical protein
MDTVIGLGNAGCNIADLFANYPQYSIKKIDVGLEKTKTSFPLQAHKSVEDYEKKLPKLQYFFRGVKGDILFVLAGGGNVSSATLATLKSLKNKCNINVLYIQPEKTLLNETQLRLEKLVFGVLQEYARSGLFSRMYVVSNSEIESLLGGIPLKEYYRKINEMLVSTFHMINTYNHLKPLENTFCTPPCGARISTFGYYDEETGEEKMFFPLDNTSDVVYYYAYSKRSLEDNVDLMKNIRSKMKEKKDLNIRPSYGIYETSYEQDYVYCLSHTSIIQK